MRFHRLALSLTGAILALALGATAATAASAYASSTVNVRSGPGTGYDVVDVLRAGQRVEINSCKGTWCLIEQRGPNGWVNASYLNADRYNERDYYDRGDYYDNGSFFLDRPRDRYRAFPFRRSQVCLGGNNASFCIRN